MTRGLWFFLLVFALHLAALGGWVFAAWRVLEDDHYLIAMTSCLVLWADAPRLCRLVQQFVRRGEQ